MASSLAASGHTIARPARSNRRADRLFFSGMAIAAALIVFTGFARTYFLKSLFGSPPLSTLLHVHGLLFTSWIGLLVAQTALVAARRTDMHRRLGVAGAVVAAAMLIVGPVAAIDAAQRGASPPGISPLAFLIVPFGDIVLFAGLAGTGLYYRRRTDTHKRLLLLATIAVLTAAIARFPIDAVRTGGPLAFFGLTDVLVLALWAFDWATLGRVHRASLWGGLLLIASQPLRLAIAGTGWWLALAAWLVG